MNRFLEPAFFAGNEANDDLNRHSIKFGPPPRTLPMPDRPGRAERPHRLLAASSSNPSSLNSSAS